MLDAIGLYFEPAVSRPSTVQNRADIACFIGFAMRSQQFRDRLPDALSRFLRSLSLIDAPGAPRERELDDVPTPRVIELLQLPVPIESWTTFTDLFDGAAATYLGAAVRSFFVQGGRRCFVVRAGDPLPLTAAREDRLTQLGALLPAWTGDLAAQAPEARAAWRGIGHLHGLPEVSCVCLPDLPFLLAEALPPPPDEEDPPPVRQLFFHECAEQEFVPPSLPPPAVAAPRMLTREGYRSWGRAINLAARVLAGTSAVNGRKDVQLIAAIPLPHSETDAETDLLQELLNAGVLEALDRSAHGISSAHVQLSYPWLGWAGAARLPESLEPPDGALAGVLARGTLLSGAFSSCADLRLRQIERLHPQLTLAQRATPQPRSLTSGEDSTRFLSLRQRVSLFGTGVDGLALDADVTTSGDEAWRPANVNRLMSVWVRALSRVGEDLVFEPSGEQTWANARQRLNLVGESLFRNGALRGQSPAEAFSVRCDRSTMTSADLDNGRLIAEVQFRPAIPLEGLVIALALDESQRISVRQEVR